MRFTTTFSSLALAAATSMDSNRVLEGPNSLRSLGVDYITYGQASGVSGANIVKSISNPLTLTARRDRRLIRREARWFEETPEATTPEVIGNDASGSPAVVVGRPRTQQQGPVDEVRTLVGDATKLDSMSAEVQDFPKAVVVQMS